MLARTIILYSHPDQPIFCTEHLTDRAFQAGFRTLNPEYRCTSDQLEQDRLTLNDFLEELDQMSDSPTDFYTKGGYIPLKMDTNRRGI